MNTPTTLRREVWPPSPETMPTDEASFHVHQANFHAVDLAELVTALNEALDNNELAEAITVAERIYAHAETVQASLIRYALATNAMTEHEVADTCDVLTPGRIKTIAKNRTQGWDKIADMATTLQAMTNDD